MPEQLAESDVPEWVKRMREDGYTVRVGSGELSEVPDVMFEPLPDPRWSFMRWVGTAVRSIFAFMGNRHSQRSAHSRRHASVP